MKKTIAGDYIKIQNYTGNIERARKSHQQERAKKKNPTSEEVKRYNKRMRAEKLQMLIILNFKDGYFITLEYSKDNQPTDYKTADNAMMRFLRSIKRERKRKDQDFKYISITERGHKGAHLHHHVLVDSLEMANMLRGSWDYGNTNIKKIYGADNAFMELSEYMLKDETKEENPNGNSYHASRNLKQPTIEREIHHGTWKEKPEPQKGYEIISESVLNGFYEPLGIKYQSYIQKRKIEPSERQQERKKIKRNITVYKNTMWHGYKQKLESLKGTAINGISAIVKSIKGA